jgi:hypothetical protein
MLKRKSSSLFPYKGGQLSCKEKFSEEVPNVGSREKGSQGKKIVCKTAISGVLLKGATSVVPALD